ncbi:MAG: phage tail tape measure protein [Desulfobacterales bacterium]
MTDLAKLVVKLEADSSRLVTQLDKSNKRLKRWENSTTKSIKRVKQQFVGLAAAYVGFNTVKNAINVHKDFTSAISDLSAITGAAGKDLEFLRQKSKEFGETTTLSASQAAEAFKLVASAKPDLLENASALAMVTKEAIALAEAAGSTLPDAAKILGSSLNQFGAGADQASRFINVLAAGAKRGASEITDTALALKDSGLVAATTGTSFEELNAAIQTMSTVSLKGAEAGTGLRNVYLNLAIQSNKLYKPSVVGLTQAIVNLKDAQLDDIQLLEIFGKKNIIAAKALIKQSDVLEGMTANLTATNTAYDQAAIKVDNLEGDTKKLNSAWEGSIILLGEKLDPAMRGVVQTMTWLSKVASSVILAVDDMGNAIGAYAAATAAALSFDFSSMNQILELRTKEREENERSLAAIWGKVEATTVLGQVDQSNVSLAEANAAALIEAQAQRNDILIQQEIDHADKLRLIYQKSADDRIKTEQRVQQSITNMRMNTFQHGANLLRLLAGESKEAAYAVIAIEKGLAIAQVIMNTQVASMRALAELGPIAGSAAAAKIQTMGAISIGLIAATGLVQASQVGGGASAGTPANPINTQSANDVQVDPLQQSQQAPQELHVTIDGVLPNDPDQLDQLAESIAENFRNGGKSPIAA